MFSDSEEVPHVQEFKPGNISQKLPVLAFSQQDADLGGLGDRRIACGVNNTAAVNSTELQDDSSGLL